MSNSAKCDNCSFEFCSVLDHATKQMNILCVACLSRYAIVHNSPYGGEPGDRLNIWKNSRKGKQTLTSQTISIVEYPSEEGLVCYLIDEVSCPTCDEFEMVMGFEDGDVCPRCKKGKLSVELAE